MIEIQELYKYYGDQRAVGPLTTNIERGEIIGLLGLNGAGKTTTLRILACDLLPTSGSVKVGGVDVVERPDQVKAKVGYLPDRPPLYEEQTVNDYLTFAARLRGVPSSQTAKLVAEAVELTELGNVSKKIIGALSHGYKQRVGIAQAIDQSGRHQRDAARLHEHQVLARHPYIGIRACLQEQSLRGLIHQQAVVDLARVRGHQRGAVGR